MKENIYDELYMNIYDNPEKTEKEVNGILEILHLNKGSKILDIGCGYGRHSIALAKQGDMKLLESMYQIYY